MRRLFAAATALVLVAAACTSGTTHTARSTTADRRFVPSATVRDAIATLDVTIPDGRRIRLRYPKALGLAQLGVNFSIGAAWQVDAGYGFNEERLSFYRARLDEVFRGQPVMTYPGAGGAVVRYFHANQRTDGNSSLALDYLVFQVGPWLVEIQDLQQPEPRDSGGRMTEADRAAWARSLVGRVDTDGYPVLTTRLPIRLEPPGTAVVVLGAPRAGARQVLLEESYCGQPGADGGARRHFRQSDQFGVAWCDPSGFRVSAAGPEAFVSSIGDRLEVARLA